MPATARTAGEGGVSGTVISPERRNRLRQGLRAADGRRGRERIRERGYLARSVTARPGQVLAAGLRRAYSSPRGVQPPVRRGSLRGVLPRVRRGPGTCHRAPSPLAAGGAGGGKTRHPGRLALGQ